MELKERNRIKKLILLFLTSNITFQEIDELNDWRNKNAKNEEIFQRMISVEHLENSIRRFKKSDLFNDREWQLIRQRTFGNEKRFNIRTFLKYAAILILPLIVGVTLYIANRNIDSTTKRDKQFASISYHGPKALLVLSDGSIVDLEKKSNLKEEILNNVNAVRVGDTLKYGMNTSDVDKEKINRIIIPRACDYSVILSDGTVVYLNSESELSYPEEFNKNIRKVSVKGQVFFNVSRDEKRPFIVDVNGMQIKVLGTSFCINAFEDEDNVITTLIEGKVKIISDNSSCDLIPGQQAILDIKTKDIKISEVNVDLYTSWKDGRIVFDKTSLKQIMNYLSRIYSIKVIFNNKKDELIPFSINITKYNNFLEIVKLLEMTNRVKFELLNDENNVNTIIVK